MLQKICRENALNVKRKPAIKCKNQPSFESITSLSFSLAHTFRWYDNSTGSLDDFLRHPLLIRKKMSCSSLEREFTASIMYAIFNLVEFGDT